MTTVSIKQTFQNGGRFTCEASEIGLPVGMYPAVILTTDIGNFQPFRYIGRRGDTMTYKQDGSPAFLDVLND